MTNPDDTPQVLEGTDVTIDAGTLDGDVDASDRPATSDPGQMTDDGALGGAAGQGGAG